MGWRGFSLRGGGDVSESPRLLEDGWHVRGEISMLSCDLEGADECLWCHVKRYEIR